MRDWSLAGSLYERFDYGGPWISTGVKVMDMDRRGARLVKGARAAVGGRCHAAPLGCRGGARAYSWSDHGVTRSCVHVAAGMGSASIMSWVGRRVVGTPSASRRLPRPIGGRVTRTLGEVSGAVCGCLGRGSAGAPVEQPRRTKNDDEMNGRRHCDDARCRRYRTPGSSGALCGLQDGPAV